jgi:hypothetical protein
MGQSTTTRSGKEDIVIFPGFDYVQLLHFRSCEVQGGHVLREVLHGRRGRFVFSFFYMLDLDLGPNK